LVIILVIGLAGYFFIFFKRDKPFQNSNGENTLHISDPTINFLDKTPLQLVANKVSLKNGTSFTLQVARDFTVTPAYEGLKRVRFMAISPDGRLFVTDMYDLSDNKKGKVYILDGFNPETKKFTKVTTYLENLRNPNNVAFYTDRDKKTWIYLSLTDNLIRYPYNTGDTTPIGPPENLATFPDYGLSYKYGGWHLTRTVNFHDKKLYVSVGSSCDLCEEKLSEPVRASILEMNPDGTDSKIYASGLRNAVGIEWVDNKFFATVMGSDQLGNDAPQDTLAEIEEGQNYGWPYCYEQDNKIFENNSNSWQRKSVDCAVVPLSYKELGAHSAPLGFDYFSKSPNKALSNYFLIALHGSGNRSIGRGYQIVRTGRNTTPEPFITGFLQGDTIFGRPADVLAYEGNSFFFSDDYGGVIYYVSKRDE